MRIVTASQMRSIDEKTIDVAGIPGIVLMENAGRAIAVSYTHLTLPTICSV